MTEKIVFNTNFNTNSGLNSNQLNETFSKNNDFKDKTIDDFKIKNNDFRDKTIDDFKIKNNDFRDKYIDDFKIKNNDFRDKYIVSLEEQIQMYKSQFSQNKIQMEEMKKKINFYEEKLHEKFVVDVAAQHNSSATRDVAAQHNSSASSLSIGDKRRFSDGTTNEESVSRRRSSSNISGNGLYSPEKTDSLHFRRYCLLFIHSALIIL